MLLLDEFIRPTASVILPGCMLLLDEFIRPTASVIRMFLYGTWCQRILEGDPTAGALTGRERLGGPAAGMG
jgi:hypothetical protein